MGVRVIPLIYIAGRYTEDHPYLIQRNIDMARYYSQEVALLGGFPICPHANLAHFEGIQDYNFFAEGNLILMRRCDAVFFIPDWQYSKGAKEEHDCATRLGMDRVYALNEVNALVYKWRNRK
jgi:hypothetical protein